MQKTKILALLLAVAMIASMVVIPASAAAPTYCTHCKKNVSDWIKWEGTGAAFEKGKHYYMESDVVLTYREAVNVDICLDLRGHTITGPSDTSEGKESRSGEVFRLYGGATVAFMDSIGGGKIKAVGVYTAGEGGNLYVGKGGTKLYAYNVEITGGKVNASSASQNLGGNVFIMAGGEAYFENCKITNGTAGDVNTKDHAGGNIYAAGNLTLVDCVVSGGTAGRAGNIDVIGTMKQDVENRVVLNILGDTEITGGNVAEADTSGAFCVRAYNYSDVNIVGNAKIDGLSLAASSKLNMYAGEIGKINVRAGDKSEHHIYSGTVNSLGGNDQSRLTVHNAYIGENTLTDASKQYVAAACATATAIGSAKLIAHAEGNCATCGHTFAATKCTTCGEAHASMAGELRLPWDGTTSIESGKYFLDKDVVVSAEVAIKGTLDLKGFTLTVTGKLDASAGNIVDSTGKGKLVGTDKVTLNAENEALPLTVGDKAVSFETVTLKQGYLGKKYAAGADAVSYAFYVNKTASKTKINEAIADGTAKLEVYVKYNDGTADAEQIFNLNADMIAAYSQDANWNGKMLCLNLTDLANVTVLEINARLVANGVTID